MRPRRRRTLAVALGVGAAGAAVAANLVLLAQARSDDPLGRLTPATSVPGITSTAPAPTFTRQVEPPAPVTAPTTTPGAPATTTQARTDGDTDGDVDHRGGGSDHDEDD